jgi:hypothetical protein
VVFCDVVVRAPVGVVPVVDDHDPNREFTGVDHGRDLAALGRGELVDAIPGVGERDSHAVIVHTKHRAVAP